MKEKSTYEELEQRVRELESQRIQWQQAEASFRKAEESEARYRGIFDHTANGVAVYKAVNDGQDFIFTDFNRACEKIECICKDEVVGKSVRQIFPGIKAFGLFDVFQRVWKTGKPENFPVSQYKDDRISGWRENYVYKLPSGEVVAVYSDETERMQAEQNLKKAKEELELKIHERTAELSVANLQLTQEINERKRAESALKISEERYRKLFENTGTATLVIEEDMTISQVNTKCEELSGYSRQEIVDKMKATDFVHPEELERVIDYHFRRRKNIEEAPPEYEIVLVDKFGNVKPLLVQIGLIAGTRQSIASLIDITPRKQADEKKRRLEAHLQQSRKMEAIGVLAGGIAHEFNNALAVVAGNIELLQMDLPDHENVIKFGQAAKTSVRRMSNLTNQLLAYARGGKYRPENINLNDFVRDTLAIMKHDVDPEIGIETDLPHNISYVNADLTQLQTVLSVIIANATEAIEGKGLLRVTTGDTIVGEEDAGVFLGLKAGKYTYLTIEDDGRGMDEETKSRIFEPFFTTKFQGRGLGMAAVYGIVKNHDGYIYIDSEPTKGTVIRILLPSVEMVEKETKIAEPELTPGTGTVLVIEDEEMLMAVVQSMLEKLGYGVLCARTGKEAIDIANTFDGDIDLALLDIKLPDMEGGRIYSIIKEYRPKMRVIVCSGYALDGPAQEILNAGAHGFIKKPFVFKEIFIKIQSLLEGK